MRYHPRMPTRPQIVASPLRMRFARMALLWMALLLALAQTAAIRHSYSHAPGETSSESGAKHTGGLAHCQTCIVAASMGCGAPPCAALTLATFVDQPTSVSPPALRLFAPQHQPYAIRASPVTFA